MKKKNNKNHDRAVTFHESHRSQAPARKLTELVTEPGIPSPFSRLQWRHSGAQSTLLTRLFFQARISRLLALSAASLSTWASVPFSSSFSFLRTCCLHNFTNCKMICPNHIRVLHRYHLSIPPYLSTKRFDTIPLDAR